MIIDYSFGRPAPADLRPAGVTGVIRYISHDISKSATAAELAELHKLGLPTALVFEDSAQRATEGADQGTADGRFAASAAHGLAVPAGRPIYVAVDFDLRDYAPASTNAREKLGPVGNYLQAFKAELGTYKYALGVYGGYWCVSRAANSGLSAWTWQTVAWSGGLIYPGIRLYQPGQQMFSRAADLDLAANDDWGQWS